METLLRFLFGAVLFAVSNCAFAQSTVEQQVDEDESTLVLERLTVTGYHIKRIDMEGPAPVVVFDREYLEQSGFQTLEDFAQFLPFNQPKEVSVSGAIGVTGFDLRGIGVDTTLTLVNGYRVAPYAQLAENTVDINSIPVSAIERIEILKDGASAIYGADAIAGVVNIILRKDYDGVEVSAGYGESQQGDGREMLADMVTGWEGARGNIMFSLSWYDREPQAMRDRDWSKYSDFSSVGGPDRRSSLGTPPSMYRYDTGLSEADPACGSDPLAGSVGGSYWGPEWGTACKYNYAQDADLLRGLERLGASLSGRYEIRPNLSLFGDLLYSKVEAEVEQAPAPILFTPLFQTETGFPFVPASHPNNPFGSDGELVSRPLGLGNRIHVNDSNAYRILAGLEGSWGAWDWSLSGLLSKNKVKKKYVNMVPLSDYQLALLGMGGPNGDLWYNPFGFQSPNDPEIIDWLTTTARLSDSTGEYSADLLFSRLFGSLPGGSVGVAVGLQYREQELDQWADEQLLSGDLGYTHEPVTADRSIFSAFTEFSLPLLYSLEAQLALRYEDYSDFGTTTNPKIALRWQPLESLMFRASYSTSFKPPSFYELYIPVYEGWDWFLDVERCDYTGSEQDCDWQQYPSEQSGNPDLDAEDGTSRFAGLVWNPGFLPGFELQLDFWEFSHEGRIEWLPGQFVLDERGDFGIIRGPSEAGGTPGRIILVRETFINVDQLLTQGFDTTLAYSWQTERAGNFRASIMHTYVSKWTVTSHYLLESDGYDYVGEYGWNGAIPRNRANLNVSWDRGSHAAAANFHYVDGFESYDLLWEDGQRTDEYLQVPSHTTLDLQYSYNFAKLRNATLRLGCNNVTDKDPPRAFFFPNNDPLHDARGRFFYIRWQQPIH